MNKLEIPHKIFWKSLKPWNTIGKPSRKAWKSLKRCAKSIGKASRTLKCIMKSFEEAWELETPGEFLWSSLKISPDRFEMGSQLMIPRRIKTPQAQLQSTPKNRVLKWSEPSNLRRLIDSYGVDRNKNHFYAPKFVTYCVGISLMLMDVFNCWERMFWLMVARG